MPKRAIHALALGLFCAMASPATSEASLISFSGSGTSGTISTPPGTIPWQYPGLASGVYSWGTPGMYAGVTTWGGADAESAFTITFTGLPSGVVISPVDTTYGGSNTTTRFNDTTAGVAWNGAVSPDGATVAFFAPSGTPLSPGHHFFINVVFSGNAGESVSFNGAFDPQLASVPEPATLSMLCAPIFLGICHTLRKRRAGAAAA